LIAPDSLNHWTRKGYVEILETQKEVNKVVDDFEVELTNKEIDERLTVKELKALCKERGLKGYSKLKEAELIELLERCDDGNESN